MEEKKFLKNKQFGLLLSVCGLVPPTKEAGFWKIPSSIEKDEVLAELETAVKEPFVPNENRALSSYIVRRQNGEETVSSTFLNAYVSEGDSEDEDAYQALLSNMKRKGKEAKRPKRRGKRSKKAAGSGLETDDSSANSSDALSEAESSGKPRPKSSSPSDSEDTNLEDAKAPPKTKVQSSSDDDYPVDPEDPADDANTAQEYAVREDNDEVGAQVAIDEEQPSKKVIESALEELRRKRQRREDSTKTEVQKKRTILIEDDDDE